MRKGIIAIIFGVVLIGLEGLSLLGNIIYGDGIIQFNSFASFIGFVLGYFLPGLCGVLLFVFGIKAYKTGETANLILHENKKVLKWIFSVLLVLMLVPSALIDFESILTPVGILYAIAAIFLLVYFWFHQGKKPSFLFAVSVIVTGCAYICVPLTNLKDLILFIIETEDATILNMFIISLVFLIACGGINILIGILLYRENFCKPLVKMLGFISFLLYFIPEIESIFDSNIYIDFYTIRYLLQLAILIYTCFMPIHTNRKIRRWR